MRFVIARMNHETNTFSPVPTPLSAFHPRWGAEALAASRDSATAMGAFVAFAARMGAEISTPVFAHANPSGPVDVQAWAAMAEAILAAVAQGCDAILLDLHGAMVMRDGRDGEGELLRQVRAAAPHTPIGVALDLHTNLSEAMVENADVLIGFKTYPHVDMVETGEHVVRLIEAMIQDRFEPKLSRVQLPLLVHTLRMNTIDPGAMRDIIEAARAAERLPGILAVSIFGGFPLADIPDAGMSVLVIAREQAQGEAVAARLATQAWSDREHFVYHEADLNESLSHAATVAQGPGEGPVVLLDHGDNCMSGGTCDTMDVIVEALRWGLEGIVAGPICDPAAVAKMHLAGQGAEIDLQIGNQLPRPRGRAEPMAVRGKVLALSDGEYVISGPTYTGMRCSMGRAAVLDIGDARLLISEQPHEPWDLGVFHSVDLDPGACQFLILKSRMYYQPVFRPIARAIIDCASPGVTSSNYALFEFTRILRPIFPIDSETEWTAQT